MRWIRLFGFMLVFSSPGFAQPVNDIVEIRIVDEGRQLQVPGRDLDIRSHLVIVPNREQILIATADLVSDENRAAAEKFAAQIPKIRSLIKESNALAGAYVELDLSLERSALAKSPEIKEFNRLKEDYFKILLSFTQAELFPGMRGEINAVLRTGMETPDENPDPEREFLGIASILASTLDSLAENLQQHLDGRVSLEIKAYHLTQANQRVLVGPTPYVEIEQCNPAPLKRFELLPSENAQKELAFARQLAPVANDIMSGEFEQQARAQIAALREKARILENALKTDLLDKIVADIKNLDIRNSQARQDIDALSDSLENLNRRLETIELALRNTDTDQAALLNNFAAAIGSLPAELDTLISGLPGQIKFIEESLRTVTRESIGRIKNDIDDYLENLKQQVIGKGLLTDYFKNVEKIAKTYRAMTEIRDAAANVNAKVNQLPVSGLVDGNLALNQFCQPRRPGDEISIEARLIGKDGAVIANPPDRVYQLRDLNWYISTRGFLAFAHPEDSDRVTTQQEYQAVPAIAWYFKKDRKNNDTYNDLWSPGYGFTAMAMNFNDNDSFELGLGLSVTFLKDLLHVSYGYNLQTESEFYSIGINPLVFQELFSK